jgi:hypothetical protein
MQSVETYANSALHVHRLSLMHQLEQLMKPTLKNFIKDVLKQQVLMLQTLHSKEILHKHLLLCAEQLQLVQIQ